eukprot:3056750-Prymnesium_polylepis.2
MRLLQRPPLAVAPAVEGAATVAGIPGAGVVACPSAVAPLLRIPMSSVGHQCPHARQDTVTIPNLSFTAGGQPNVRSWESAAAGSSIRVMSSRASHAASLSQGGADGRGDVHVAPLSAGRRWLFGSCCPSQRGSTSWIAPASAQRQRTSASLPKEW